MNVARLPLSPIQAFVLAQLDGVADLEELGAVTNLDEVALGQALHRLAELGVVDGVVDGARAVDERPRRDPRREDDEPIDEPPPRATGARGKSVAPRASARSVPPARATDAERAAPSPSDARSQPRTSARAAPRDVAITARGARGRAAPVPDATPATRSGRSRPTARPAGKQKTSAPSQAPRASVPRDDGPTTASRKASSRTAPTTPPPSRTKSLPRTSAPPPRRPPRDSARAPAPEPQGAIPASKATTRAIPARRQSVRPKKASLPPEVASLPPQVAVVPPPRDESGSRASGVRRETLSTEERKRIDEVFARLETDTHYQLLGVGMGATTRDLERALSERVSPFDPARHRDKDLGAHAERLATVFSRLSYAHEILSTPSRRGEYDEYLALREATRYLEAAIVVPPSRAPTASLSAGAARDADGTPSAPRVALLDERTNEPTPDAPPSMPPAPESAPFSTKQRNEQSLQDLRRVLHAGRSAAERQPYVAAAERAFAEGQWVSALNAARVALSLDPANDAMRALHDAASAKAAAELATPYRSRASYEEEKGDWEAAARSHQRVAEGSPGDARPLLKAAECLLRAGTDPRAAVRLARAGVALTPDAASARLTLARAYESAGSIASAIGELQRALALTPQDATIAPWLARLQEPRKLPFPLVESLPRRRGLPEDPRMPPALLSLARTADLAALSASCEARIVARQWASSSLWSPEPLYFERNRYSRGRKLATQPKASRDAVLYGYDEAGCVARIRHWSGFLARWHQDELFVQTGPRVRVCYRFRADGTLLNVHRYTDGDDGRLVRHEVLFAPTRKTGEQRYVWEDGRLVRVDVRGWGHGWALTWDASGRLEAIAEVSDGASNEIYRRPPDGETLDALFDIVRERLLVLVPRLCAKVRPRSVAYCVALVVDEEEWRHPLPPMLAMGFEEDRVRVIAEADGSPRDELWSAAELPTFDVPGLELKDARLSDASRRANQHLCASGRQARATKLLRAVAADLRSLDWSGIRPVTRDFVVYVTRLEGDGYRDVKREAPPAVLRSLVRRGLL